MKDYVLNVKDLSKMVRVPLSEQEAALFKIYLAMKLKQFDELGEVDLTGVPPTVGLVSAQNVLREDAPSPCLDRKTTLKNAPQQDGEHILTPIIMQ